MKRLFHQRGAKLKMFNFIKRLFIKDKPSITPKGQSFIKYFDAKKENTNHPTITAYDDAMDRMVYKLGLKMLEREKEFLKSHPSRKYIIQITEAQGRIIDESCIGLKCEVYDYNDKYFSRTGDNFGILIDKSKCKLL